MDRILTIGATGADVIELQVALNRHPPTQLPPLKTDGIFGLKTSARVKEFQRNNGLQIDGIVGSKTWMKLRALQPQVTPRTGILCGNSDPANQGKALSIRNTFVSSITSQGGFSSLAMLPSLPSFRPLTVTQITTARGVYGFSLDFSRIFISDQSGLGGRPFTVAIPATLISPTIQIINCGTFTPSTDTLIHELAHVWQSQHHSSPTQFITNAVGSQAKSVAANEALALIDLTVKSNPDFPVQFPFSAYAFVPGKPFGEYAAEQIANAVEHGVSTIVSHIKSVGLGAIDSDNQTSLGAMRIGDRRTPSIVF